jgi:hypothetical protein
MLMGAYPTCRLPTGDLLEFAGGIEAYGRGACSSSLRKVFERPCAEGLCGKPPTAYLERAPPPLRFTLRIYAERSPLPSSRGFLRVFIVGRVTRESRNSRPAGMEVGRQGIEP